MEGRNFLVVTIHQIQTLCEDCHSVVLGVIDLDHGNRTQSIEMRGRLRTLDGPAGSARHASNAPIMILRTAVGNGFNGGLLEERVTLLDGDKPTFRLEASKEKTVESWEGGRPSR